MIRALAILLLLPSLAHAGVVAYYTTGQQLYVRFDDDDNTAVDLVEGTSLKAGRYAVADAAIQSAGLDAGAFSGRIFIGTAGAQSSGDVEVAIVPEFRWSGTAQIDIPAATKAAMEEEGGLLKQTADTVGENLDAKVSEVEGGGGGGTVIPVNQVVVPDSRTWILKATVDGLKDETKRTMRVGETKVFAIDFRNDLPTNGRLSDVEPLGIEEGTGGGVTFAATDNDPGVDKTQAKVSITAVTAGTYEIECGVEYEAGDGGGTSRGVVTLVVAE